MDISPDKVVEFETAVRPVPQQDPDNMQMISQGPSVCIFNKPDPGEVLASWLFAQFLLTNDVQIAYSGTEGYLPVTSKAQQSDEYQKYLDAAGTDTKEHYQIKIDASRLIMDHTDETFVTPVFNGSASLRDAAGYLIEDVSKGARRKKEIDDKYLKELFENTRKLYHLDQIQVSGAEENSRDLGPFPATAVGLLALLGAAWVLILLYLIVDRIRSGKK